MSMRAAPLLLLLALAGCGDSETTPGLSRSDDKQLDQAAAAIDVNAMDNKEAGE